MRQISLMVLVLAAVAAGGCAGPVTPEARQWLESGNESLRRNDNAAAVDAASRFIQAYPKAEEASEAYYIRGLAEFRQKQNDAARADLTQALALAKRKDLLALTQLALGNLAYTSGDMAGAERYFRGTLVDTPPGAPPADEAAFLLGCILQRQGHWVESDILFSRVMYYFKSGKLAKLAEDRINARRWSIQAGAYENAAVAQQMTDKLIKAGLAARIDSELRSERLMRLVRVGAYPSYEAAEADLPKVKKVQTEAFVAPAR